MKCPDPPVVAVTAPGRGWTLAARRRPEEAQSGAYAPPQGRPTRPLSISRGPSPPLPTTHTLTRVGGPTGPCRWPSLSTAETTAMTTHVVSLRPLILSTRPPPPACWQCSCLGTPNHSVTRQDKQLTPRLCCPCAGVWRQPERIRHRQCCHASGMRIWHGSGLWYHCPITKTPGDRQVVPLSNAALPAPPVAFKSPDGEEDGRGDESSCGSRSEVRSVSGR